MKEGAQQMILPKGKAVYANLRTSFVDFNSFLQTLRDENFTGYVQLTSWDYAGVLFLELGEIVNAIEDTEGKKRVGEEAVENIMVMSKQKGGKIDVYQLAPEMVTILASTSDEEAVYSNLTTEFTQLDKLLGKLRNDKHSGYVEILLNGRQGQGIVFFQQGEIAEAVMYGGQAGDDAAMFGKELVPKMIEDAERVGATFNVYQVGLSAGRSTRTEMADTKDLENVVEVLQSVLGRVEDLVDSMANHKGTFRDSFRRAQVDKSEQYPFLDPFLAEFEYREGEILFLGRVRMQDFVQGIKECLGLTVERLPLKISRDELYARIKSTLHPIVDQYRERIEKYELKSTMPEIFGP